MNTTLWAEHELLDAKLPDQRLRQRLVRLAADLADAPNQSIPQALDSWANTKAAYRFFDNQRVEPDAIAQAHHDRTVQRLPEDLVLAIQDTTALDFSAHPATKGLGYLQQPHQCGLLVHSTLAVSKEGVPLGLLHQQVWTRDPQYFGKRKQRRHKPTKDKESQRWLNSLEAVNPLASAQRPLLVVGDREADFFDLFTAPRAANVHLLVRARSRRRVRHELGLLGAAVAALPVSGRMTVPLPRGNERPARPATLTLRGGAFWVEPPSTHPRRKELAPVRLRAVLAQEELPPAGQKAVRWLLLTTRPVGSATDAEQVVRWYTQRWLIERYHYTLKSGCRVEQLQLEQSARLRRALAVYGVVAWRLLWLTYQARATPAAPCVDVLEAEEWEVLYHQVYKKPRATQALPTWREAIRGIARLGGFLGRRGDGEPGVKVLWRGLTRLQDLVTGFRLAKNHLDTPEFTGNG